MIKSLLITLCLIINSVGCSVLIHSDQFVDKVELKPQVETSEEVQYCGRSNFKVQYLGGSEYFQNELLNLLKATKSLNLSVREQFLLAVFTMIQFRPDQFGHSARIQVFEARKGKVSYEDIFQNPKVSLYDVLARQSSLEKIQKILSGHKINPKVGPDLKENLALIQSTLFQKKILKHKGKRPSSQKKPQVTFDQSNIKAFAKYFTRGENLVIAGEGLKTFNVLNFLKAQKKEAQAIYAKSTPLWPPPTFLAKSEELSKAGQQCNIDLNLYRNSMQIISPNKIRPAVFAIAGNDEFYYISSTQEFESTSIHPSFPTILSGAKNSRPIPICWNNTGNQFQFASASYARDMGQLLYSAVALGILETSSREKVIDIINHPRNMLLQTPPRILVEEHAGKSKLIDDFYDLRIPVYGVKEIGRLFFAGNFSSGAPLKLVGDKRALENHVYCY